MMCKKFRVVALKMNIYYNLCFTGETSLEVKMSETPVKNAGLSELTQLGIKFYEENLKATLEPQHNGKFVAIEPYSGTYFIESKKLDAILKTRAKMPDKLFFLAKIGTIYTGSLSHYVLKNG